VAGFRAFISCSLVVLSVAIANTANAQINVFPISSTSNEAVQRIGIGILTLFQNIEASVGDITSDLTAHVDQGECPCALAVKWKVPTSDIENTSLLITLNSASSRIEELSVVCDGTLPGEEVSIHYAAGGLDSATKLVHGEPVISLDNKEVAKLIQSLVSWFANNEIETARFSSE